MEWLAENKEWLFSGIGATALAGFFAFFSKTKPKKQTTTNTNFTETATSVTGTKINAGNITNIIVNNGSNAAAEIKNHHSTILSGKAKSSLNMSVDDILNDIASRPPFQQDEVQKHYIGTYIDFSGVLRVLHKHNDKEITVSLGLESDYGTKVRFNVDVNDFPTFKFMRQGTPVSVTGRIQGFTILNEIKLEDIILH